jgi:hypothetical protein
MPPTPPPKITNIGASTTDNSKVAVLTLLVEAPKDAYHSIVDYQTVYPLAAHSIKTYTDKHGYKFHVERQLATNDSRQAYWSKMAAVRKMLDLQYEWVLYTDVDVLILDHEQTLQEFMVNRDVITVNECSTKGRSNTNHLPRSGFMLFRNTKSTYKFLDEWESSFDYYESIENPEQSSLEVMAVSPAWRDNIHLHEWSSFHSYDTCDYGYNSFSMHFPGHSKVTRMARSWMFFSHHNDQKHAWARDEKLSQYAANILREDFVSYFRSAIAKKFTPPVERRLEVESCLNQAAIAGYDIKQVYDENYHAYVEYYLAISHLTNIPTVIYLTVPSIASIPETAFANIQVRANAACG